MIVVLSLVATFGLTALLAARERSNDTKCRDNLRRIGLAAIQYCDDERFFPHFSPLHELDGDYRSDTAARAARLLIARNAGENLEEAFVCPSSPDELSATGKPALGPLREATDLSYGWTRQCLTSNVQGWNWPIAGDKARRIPERADDPERSGQMCGNHRGGMNVVCVGIVVCKVTPDFDGNYTTHNLAGTGPNDGFLGVLGD